MEHSYHKLTEHDKHLEPIPILSSKSSPILSSSNPTPRGTPDAKHRDLKDEFNKLNGYVSPRYSKLENQDDVFIKSPSSIEMKPHVSFKSKPPPLVTRTSKSSYSEREQDLEKAIRGYFRLKRTMELGMIIFCAACLAICLISMTLFDHINKAMYGVWAMCSLAALVVIIVTRVISKRGFKRLDSLYPDTDIKKECAELFHGEV